MNLLRSLWAAFIGWLLSFFAKKPARREAVPGWYYVPVKAFKEVTPHPPPMHWAPCNPSTMKRFKASMTCPNGHALTLRDHAIAENGDVTPSVVCTVPGCDFHQYVQLERWSYGRLSRLPQ